VIVILSPSWILTMSLKNPEGIMAYEQALQAQNAEFIIMYVLKCI